MIDEVKVRFSEIPWESPGVGVRFKAFTRNGKRIRLVEFTNEFIEEDWCENGHIGYVLEGTLEVSFPQGTMQFSAGDGVFIAGGDAEKHKAAVIGEKATLILVEEV
jgi:ethanolamine utilization protein EutQ (cupin superfamily)